MILTWKDPSDGGITRAVTPISWSDTPGFIRAQVAGFDHVSKLSINSLKANGEYQTTPMMRSLIDQFFQNQEIAKQYNVT